LAFPALLRRVLTEVGSGAAVRRGWVVLPPSECVRRLELPGSECDEALLPFADWGCGIQSLVAFDAHDGRTWWIDPNASRDHHPDTPPYASRLRLSEWMANAASGLSPFHHDQWPPPWLHADGSPRG
jgi:hypothetical protein